MLNIVVPMAGRGSRFVSAGYILPKPLTEIHKNPMIAYVIKNLTPLCEHRFIFLCLKEHIEKYDLKAKLRELSPNSIIVEVNQVTEGAACTVLLAEEFINNTEQLMIANSDQYVDMDINDYLSIINHSKCDGLIMTMRANDLKWSYIRYNEDGFVTEVREKEVISEQATVGIYNFFRGKDFIEYAKVMIEKNERVNGEFYVAPVYNEMVNNNKKIRFYDIGDLNDKMYGLGIPEDLKKFELLPLSHVVFKKYK